MPVFNGAPTLERAINSLLAQSFGDFELIISDNASTDATEEICLRYAASDQRVRYFRQAKNLGSLRNFEFVLLQARGEFFHWAAHDDAWDKEFGASAVRMLRSRPDASGAMGRVHYVNSDGDYLRQHTPPYRLGGALPADRAKSYFENSPTDTLVYGVFRTEVMQFAPFVVSTCPEKILIMHALLSGPIVDAPEMLYVCELTGKSQAEVATLIGIPAYNFEYESRLFCGVLSLLAKNLDALSLARVMPLFVFRNNWHKFYVREAFRRIGILRART